jgi:pimeloyl-ACP methyl ester carboxylesterase
MLSLKLLLIPLFLYLALLVLLYAGQTRLLFPTSMARGSDRPAFGERLTLRTPSGERLQGLYIAPASAPADAPLILGFGGNAWNADAAAATLHALYPRAHVIAFHYRGYAPSTGSPSAAAITRDSLLIHDRLKRRFPEAPIVTVGFSIGSGVAAYLAKERPLAGAILVTPFDSLARVAADHYRWLPVRLLFRHEMKAAQWLGKSRARVAILAAERDTLILPGRTEALRKALPNLAFDRVIPGAGHNDVYDHPAFASAMREALVRCLGGRREGGSTTGRLS